ncbi:hypothetical protein, partial [Aestuariivirga sp.]|uniref:hypothetical protein n=1 Tax=Aestuariivirga sp. TaxID=2650926 RepID=UPI0030193D72
VNTASGHWFVDNPFVRDIPSMEAQLCAPEMQALGACGPGPLLDALCKLTSMGKVGKDDDEEANRWRWQTESMRAVVFFTDSAFTPAMSLPEAGNGDVQETMIRLMNERIVLIGFVPEWSGYFDLFSVDRSEMFPVAAHSEYPAIEGLGSAFGSERAAAEESARAAFKSWAASPQMNEALTKLGKLIVGELHRAETNPNVEQPLASAPSPRIAAYVKNSNEHQLERVKRLRTNR